MKRWSRLILACFLGALLFASVTRAEDEEGEKEDKADEIGTVIGIDLGTTYSW